jgi:protease-4
MKAKVSDFNVSSYPKKLTPFEQLFKDMEKEQMTLKMLKSKLSDEQFLIYQQLSDPKFKEGVRMEMPFQIKF